MRPVIASDRVFYRRLHALVETDGDDVNRYERLPPSGPVGRRRARLRWPPTTAPEKPDLTPPDDPRAILNLSAAAVRGITRRIAPTASIRGTPARGASGHPRRGVSLTAEPDQARRLVCVS